MSHHAPYAAVVATLTTPPDFTPEPEPVHGLNDRVPRATALKDGPFARDPDGIAVIKERQNDERRLYALSFDDLSGNRWFWLVAAERHELGWVAHGAAGGSDGPSLGGQATPRRSSVGSGPWLNLCGQWGGETFYAGGELHAAGGEIGRVRITLTDGSQLEDDGIGDVSLFIGRRGEPPKTIDLFAPDSTLLSSREAF